MNNAAIAAMLLRSSNRDASNAAAKAISDRRMAALTASGDYARNTPAWQDAAYEASMLSLLHSGI